MRLWKSVQNWAEAAVTPLVLGNDAGKGAGYTVGGPRKAAEATPVTTACFEVFRKALLV